jgi:hypothetical protein
VMFARGVIPSRLVLLPIRKHGTPNAEIASVASKSGRLEYGTFARMVSCL